MSRFAPPSGGGGVSLPKKGMLLCIKWMFMHSCVHLFLMKNSAIITKKQDCFLRKTPAFDEFGKTFNNYMPQLDKGAGSYYNIVYIYAYIIQNIHF